MPQQLAGGDIYPALEKGTIDAPNGSARMMIEKLGLQKVAQYYYYPGWWEGCASLTFFYNQEKWNELPKNYQSILRAAAAQANGDMLANYDTKNPAAVQRLVKAGAQLRRFPMR